jgi:hypothetical protein
MSPKTLQEWQQYVQSLYGAPLRSKAIAANSQRFVDNLLEDGQTVDDANRIILFFVRQMSAVGMKIPSNGILDMVAMAREDKTAWKGQQLSDAEIRKREAMPLES